jgi:hypothetical protein
MLELTTMNLSKLALLVVKTARRTFPEKWRGRRME